MDLFVLSSNQTLLVTHKVEQRGYIFSFAAAITLQPCLTLNEYLVYGGHVCYPPVSPFGVIEMAASSHSGSLPWKTVLASYSDQGQKLF